VVAVGFGSVTPPHLRTRHNLFFLEGGVWELEIDGCESEIIVGHYEIIRASEPRLHFYKVYGILYPFYVTTITNRLVHSWP